MRPFKLSAAFGISLLLATYYQPRYALADYALAEQPQDKKPTKAKSALQLVDVRDVVKLNVGLEAATQGAGTPNRIGPQIFLPLVTTRNSTTFIDFEGFYTLPDTSTNSSIVNTLVSGYTFGTSTRLGHRWLTEDRSWMFGVNFGYDTLPVDNVSCAYGKCINPNIYIEDPRTAFFQQIAFGAEAVSNRWRITPSIAIPIGSTEQQINSRYWAGALQTYFLEVGYNVTPSLLVGAAYYYQNGDDNTADGSGVVGRVSYEIFPNTTISALLSYDQAFGTRVSTGIKYKFNLSNPDKKPLKEWDAPQIKALSEHIQPNRVIRVHDSCKASTVDDGDCASDPSVLGKRCIYGSGKSYTTKNISCAHFYQSKTAGKTPNGGAALCGYYAPSHGNCNLRVSSHNILIDDDND